MQYLKNKRMDALTDMASARKALRCELDALADIVVDASSVSFRHEIRTLRAPETFCETPRDVMARTESLLDADITDGVARTVHDTVTVAIGCNRVPLFAVVEGGRARTLFTFRCVYDGCPAFMDIRTFVAQWGVKWIIVCVSHAHSFDVFPARMPRSTFPDGVVRMINDKVVENKTTAEIRRELTSCATRMSSRTPSGGHGRRQRRTRRGGSETLQTSPGSGRRTSG